MALTIGQFAALFLFNCLAGAFTALVCTLATGVWGGIKPLTNRIKELESDHASLEGRFTRQQKSMAGVKSVETRMGRIPKEFAQPPPMEREHEDPEIEYVG